MTEAEKVQTNVTIDKALKTDIQHIALDDGLTLSSIVESALVVWRKLRDLPDLRQLVDAATKDGEQ